MRKSLTMLTLAATLALSGCFGGPAVLTDPAPVYVPPGTHPETVRGAILSVLDGRQWRVESDQGSQIVALLVVNRHSARVMITHGPQGVYLQYIDCQALDYYVDNAGRQRIHRNYNRWTERLARRIEQALQGAGTPVIVFTP